MKNFGAEIKTGVRSLDGGFYTTLKRPGRAYTYDTDVFGRDYLFCVEFVLYPSDGTSSSFTTYNWYCPRIIQMFYIHSEVLELATPLNYPLRHWGRINSEVPIVLQAPMDAGTAIRCPWTGVVDLVDQTHGQIVSLQMPTTGGAAAAYVASTGGGLGQGIPTPGLIAIPDEMTGQFFARFTGRI